MLQKERNSSHCSGGILADDQVYQLIFSFVQQSGTKGFDVVVHQQSGQVSYVSSYAFQGLGKTISAISLILTERAPLPRSSAIKHEPCEAVTLDDDDDEPAELCLKKRPYTCSSEVASTTV